SGVRCQRPLHVRLAERHAGLQQVAAVGTHYHDLPRAQAGAEQQAVEAVVLERPGPGGGEGFAEVALRARDVDAGAVAVFEFEVLDPGGTAVRPGELVGALGDDAQAEILQHGQHVRDRYRVAELDDLQMHALAALAGGAVQVQLQRLRVRAQAFEIAKIAEHFLRRDVVLVGERKGAPVTGRERQARCLAAALDEHVAQPVGPGQRGFGDALLDAREVGLVARGGVGTHHHVHTRVARAGDLRVTLHAGAGEALERQLLDALAYLGVVAVARHVHQARVEAVIRVATYQQAHRAPLVEVDHAAHDADQVLGAGLEQLIARVGLEYVDHRLAVVAGRIQPEVLDDALDLAAQHRDVARAAVVCGRGPESQEAVLAIDTAACIEGLDADVIEQLAAVHGGGGVGLGDDQQLQLARGCARRRAARWRAPGARGGAWCSVRPDPSAHPPPGGPRCGRAAGGSGGSRGIRNAGPPSSRAGVAPRSLRPPAGAAGRSPGAC